jgi:hypothetical protein
MALYDNPLSSFVVSRRRLQYLLILRVTVPFEQPRDPSAMVSGSDCHLLIPETYNLPFPLLYIQTVHTFPLLSHGW